MTVMSARRAAIGVLLGTSSLLAWTNVAQAQCAATAVADNCQIDAGNVGTAPVGALTNQDTIRLGGVAPSAYVFNPALLTADLVDLFKEGTSTVTLSGVAAFKSDWQVVNGVLIVSGNSAVTDFANLSTSRSTMALGQLVLNTSNKALGSLTNAGRTVLNDGATALFNVTGYSGGSAAAPAELVMDFRPNAANAPVAGTSHDRLNVAGVATGVTNVTVNILAPSDDPAPTNGDGVELIRAAGGTAAGAFRLTQPVLQGGFQYLLQQAASGGGQTGFFLQSAVREELFANAIAVAASRSTVRALAFADRGIEAAEGIGSRLRAWLTVHGGVEQNGIESGARFDQDFWGVTAGIDSGFTPNIRLGVQAGYGQTDADIFLRQGASKLEGDTWFAQVYAQYLSGPWFADASIGYASTEWDFARAVLAPGLAPVVGETVDGVIGKIGGGYRFSFDEPFFVTVSGHVLYDGASCGSGCFLAGVREDTSDWAGRLAVRFERPYLEGALRPYLAVSYTDDFSDGHEARLGQALVRIDSANSLLGLNAGLNYTVAPNAHLFLDLGAQRSLGNDTEAYQGQVGFRMTW
jgi:hypothetical protein